MGLTNSCDCTPTEPLYWYQKCENCDFHVVNGLFLKCPSWVVFKKTSKHGIWPHILREKIHLPLLCVGWLVFAQCFFHNNTMLN